MSYNLIAHIDWRTSKLTKCSVGEYALEALDADEDVRGAMEKANGNATNAQKALGRLVDLLISRGLISLDDVAYLFGTEYGNLRPVSVEIVEDEA